MKAKVPNAKTKDYDQAKYFDNTTDGGIRCIAAALSIDETTHIVVCAPDAVKLGVAWKKLTTVPLDIKKCPVVLYKYEAGITVENPAEYSITKKDDTVTVKVTDEHPWYWFYRRKGNICFIESHQERESDIKLGSAEHCDEAECKLLLRQNKIPRSCLDTMTVDCSIDDLIPF